MMTEERMESQLDAVNAAARSAGLAYFAEGARTAQAATVALELAGDFPRCSHQALSQTLADLGDGCRFQAMGLTTLTNQLTTAAEGWTLPTSDQLLIRPTFSTASRAHLAAATAHHLVADRLFRMGTGWNNTFTITEGAHRAATGHHANAARALCHLIDLEGPTTREAELVSYAQAVAGLLGNLERTNSWAAQLHHSLA